VGEQKEEVGMSEWRPIHTAPKDRKILVWSAEEGSVDCVWWFEGKDIYGRPESGWVKNWDSVFDGPDEMYQAPDMWMPIPEPPEGE
jgi:hypothetical protein